MKNFGAAVLPLGDNLEAARRQSGWL